MHTPIRVQPSQQEQEEVRQFGVGLYAETLESMSRKRSGLWPLSVDKEEK